MTESSRLDREIGSRGRGVKGSSSSFILFASPSCNRNKSGSWQIYFSPGFSHGQSRAGRLKGIKATGQRTDVVKADVFLFCLAREEWTRCKQHDMSSSDRQNKGIISVALSAEETVIVLRSRGVPRGTMANSITSLCAWEMTSVRRLTISIISEGPCRSDRGSRRFNLSITAIISVQQPHRGHRGVAATQPRIKSEAVV